MSAMHINKVLNDASFSVIQVSENPPHTFSFRL